MPSPAASSAPATTSAGARSPPRASTATVIKLRSGRRERLDVAAAVRLARGAGVMRARRRSAVRARVDARERDPVLGAALVAAGLGGLSLRDSHGRPGSVPDRRGVTKEN